MAKSILYVKVFPEQSYVPTSGIGFRMFYDSISEKPQNMLLLSNAFSKAKIDRDIFLEYVDEAAISELYRDDIYNYGDFCWVDYSYEGIKRQLSQQTLAELLYVNHYKKPLHSAFWSELENNYAYLAHDDDWWVKIYLRDIGLIEKVVHNKILHELKGRKKFIADITKDIFDSIWSYSVNGLAFDFEGASITAGCTGVRFYPIGSFEDMDEMQRHLIWLRKKLVPDSDWLDYNSRSKKWSIY